MNSDDKLIITLFLLLITAILAYSKYLQTQKDISELALQDQSSQSTTRKPHETASFRSRLVSHGFPLLHGLSIKHSYKLRDGNLRDVWCLAMDTAKEAIGQQQQSKVSSARNQGQDQGQGLKEIKFYNNNGKITFQADYFQLNGLFKHLNARVHQLLSPFYVNTSQNNDNGAGDDDNANGPTIATVLPVYSYQNFLLSMTSFLNNMTLHSFHGHLVPLTSADPLVVKIDIMFVLKKDIKKALTYYGQLVKIFVVVDDYGTYEAAPSAATNGAAKTTTVRKAYSWREFLAASSAEAINDQQFADSFNDPNYDYIYDSKYDDFIPLKETLNYNTTIYTNQNLVSAIANELKSLPMNQEWNASSDRLVIFNQDSSLTIWNKILTGVMLGMDISVVEPLKLHEIKSIDLDSNRKQRQREAKFIVKKFLQIMKHFETETANPESQAKSIISVIPAFYLKCFVDYQQQQQQELSVSGQSWLPGSMITQLKQARSQALFQQLIFNQLGEIPQFFHHTRVIYAPTFTNFLQDTVSSWDLAMIRSLTGSRVVAERYLPGCVGAFFATNLYDYRVVDDEESLPSATTTDAVGVDANGTALKYINRGIPSQTIEAKLVDYKLLNETYQADNNQGELCIRGFIIGKCVDTEVIKQMTQEATRVGGQGWMPCGVVGKLGDDGCFYEKVFEL